MTLNGALRCCFQMPLFKLSAVSFSAFFCPMATTFVDTHCNVPNVLRALNVDYKDAGQTWHSLLPHFPSPSAPWTLAGCISVSSDMESHFDTLELMKCENVYGAFGIHPLYAYEVQSSRLLIF